MSTHDPFEVEVDDGEKGLYKLNIEPEKKNGKEKLLSSWEKYGEKIILAVGIILIAVVSFEAGFLRGEKNRKDSIVVNQPACAPCPKSEENGSTGVSDKSSQQNSQSAVENQKCAFAASKNSDKYHLSTCQWTQKIKSENKVCFSSAEEAQSRGYQGAKCCIK
jgi:hypothetical protein